MDDHAPSPDIEHRNDRLVYLEWDGIAQRLVIDVDSDGFRLDVAFQPDAQVAGIIRTLADGFQRVADTLAQANARQVHQIDLNASVQGGVIGALKQQTEVNAVLGK